MLILALPALVAGCAPAPATVHGTVSVDGKPLADGVISFVPAAGNASPVTVPIEDGAYELATVAGPKRVQISAPVVVGKRREHNGSDAPLVEIRAESLPERYHSKTELTFEVKPGSNTKDWELESAERKP